MTRTRLTLAVLVAALTLSSAIAGGFQRKGRLDAARVKSLVETLRADSDERKRKAAAAELRDADPRTHSDVVTALVGSLQRDTSPGVRGESADSLRHFRVVFPVAGMALESAAEGDPSPLVRDAAQQALWEYHLGGYRSSKGSDGFAGQTAEPPLARPASRVAKASAAIVIPVAAVKPVETISLSPPKIVPSQTQLVKPQPTTGIRTVISAAPPPVMNQTPEPPLAKRPATSPTPTLPISIPIAPAGRGR